MARKGVPSQTAADSPVTLASRFPPDPPLLLKKGAVIPGRESADLPAFKTYDTATLINNLIMAKR